MTTSKSIQVEKFFVDLCNIKINADDHGVSVILHRPNENNQLVMAGHFKIGDFKKTKDYIRGLWSVVAEAEKQWNDWGKDEVKHSSAIGNG